MLYMIPAKLSVTCVHEEHWLHVTAFFPVENEKQLG